MQRQLQAQADVKLDGPDVVRLPQAEVRAVGGGRQAEFARSDQKSDCVQGYVPPASNRPGKGICQTRRMMGGVGDHCARPPLLVCWYSVHKAAILNSFCQQSPHEVCQPGHCRTPVGRGTVGDCRPVAVCGNTGVMIFQQVSPAT